MTVDELRNLLADVPGNAEVMVCAPLGEALGPLVDRNGHGCGTLVLPTRGIRHGLFPLGAPPGAAPTWVTIEGCGPWAQSGRRLA